MDGDRAGRPEGGDGATAAPEEGPGQLWADSDPAPPWREAAETAEGYKNPGQWQPEWGPSLATRLGTLQPVAGIPWYEDPPTLRDAESTSPKLAELHYRKSFYSPDVDRSRWDALMWKDYNDFRQYTREQMKARPEGVLGGTLKGLQGFSGGKQKNRVERLGFQSFWGLLFSMPDLIIIKDKQSSLLPLNWVFVPPVAPEHLPPPRLPIPAELLRDFELSDTELFEGPSFFNADIFERLEGMDIPVPDWAVNRKEVVIRVGHRAQQTFRKAGIKVGFLELRDIVRDCVMHYPEGVPLSQFDVYAGLYIRRGVKLLKFFMGTKRGYGWRDVLLGMPDLARLKGSRRSSCTILPSLRLLREVHPAAAGRLRPAAVPSLPLPAEAAAQPSAAEETEEGEGVGGEGEEVSEAAPAPREWSLAIDSPTPSNSSQDGVEGEEEGEVEELAGLRVKAWQEDHAEEEDVGSEEEEPAPPRYETLLPLAPQWENVPMPPGPPTPGLAHLWRPAYKEEFFFLADVLQRYLQMNQGGLKVTMLLRLPGFSNPAIAKLLVQLGYTRLSHFIRAIPEVVTVKDLRAPPTDWVLLPTNPIPGLPPHAVQPPPRPPLWEIDNHTRKSDVPFTWWHRHGFAHIPKPYRLRPPPSFEDDGKVRRRRLLEKAEAQFRELQQLGRRDAGEEEEAEEAEEEEEVGPPTAARAEATAEDPWQRKAQEPEQQRGFTGGPPTAPVFGRASGGSAPVPRFPGLARDRPFSADPSQPATATSPPPPPPPAEKGGLVPLPRRVSVPAPPRGNSAPPAERRYVAAAAAPPPRQPEAPGPAHRPGGPARRPASPDVRPLPFAGPQRFATEALLPPAEPAARGSAGAEEGGAERPSRRRSWDAPLPWDSDGAGGNASWLAAAEAASGDAPLWSLSDGPGKAASDEQPATGRPAGGSPDPVPQGPLPSAAVPGPAAAITEIDPDVAPPVQQQQQQQPPPPPPKSPIPPPRQQRPAKVSPYMTWREVPAPVVGRPLRVSDVARQEAKREAMAGKEEEGWLLDPPEEGSNPPASNSWGRRRRDSQWDSADGWSNPSKTRLWCQCPCHHPARPTAGQPPSGHRKVPSSAGASCVVS